MEIHLIKQYGRFDLNEGTLVNMTDGGDGVQNLTPDVIQKIKMKNIGKPGTMLGKFGKDHPAYGTIRSDETKYKMKENHHKCWKGKPLSDNHKEKIKKSTTGKLNHMYGNGYKITGDKNGFYGKHHSIEFIKKFGKCIIQYDMNGNFIREWLSISMASNTTGVAKSQIRRCCNGISKSGGGFLWKFK